jgi:protein BCP1
MFQEKPSFQQIRNYVLENTKDNPTIAAGFKSIFDDKKPLGIILNERMVNVPPQIAPAFHRSLFDEIEKSHKVGYFISRVQ